MRPQAALALPGGHVAAQPVGILGAVVGGDHGDFHDLLLKNRNAQRAPERLGQAGLAFRVVRIGRVGRGVVGRTIVGDGQTAPPTLARLQVRVHHAAADRPRPHDGDLHHQVVEGGGLQARQHAHLRAAFDLEGAHGVGAADHAVGFRTFALDIGARERPATPTRDHFKAAPHGREHAQCQHVDLHQAQRVEVVLVPLDDLPQRGARRQPAFQFRADRVGAGGCFTFCVGVGPLHGIAFHGRVFQRHQAVQGRFGQHEAADVLAQVARRAAQLLGQLQPQAGQRGRDGGADRGRQIAQAVRGQAVVEPVVILGEGVDQPLVHAQRAAHVAQGAAPSVADDRGAQSGAAAAVFAVDVLDDFFAPLVLEIDVDVGRLVLARLADEALQQRVGFFGVGGGDAQAIADDRIGRRAAPLAQDALPSCPAHDVVHGEEEHLVPAFLDQGEFLVDEALNARRHAFGKAPGGAFAGQLRQGFGRRQALDDRLFRIVVLDFVQPERAARGHRQRGGQQVGRVHRRQPLARAQVALGVGLQRETAGMHRLADADGGHHVVQAFARAHVHVHVAGRRQRPAGGGGQRAQLRQPKGIVGATVQLGQQRDF